MAMVSPFQIPRLELTIDDAGFGGSIEFGLELTPIGEDEEPVKIRRFSTLPRVIQEFRELKSEVWPTWVSPFLSFQHVFQGLWEDALAMKTSNASLTSSLMVYGMAPDHLRFVLLLQGVAEKFRHHGDWHNVAKFEKAGKPIFSLNALETTLRDWRRNPYWRAFYHIRHPISWE